MTSAVTPRHWRSAPVSDLISIAHGFAFKGEYFSEYGRDAVTTPGNFLESGGFRYTGTKQRYYSGAIPEAYRLDAGDLIVAMTEQAEGLLGSTAWVPGAGSWLHNQRIGRIRAKSGDVSLKYLYCVFNSFEFRKSVAETAAGTKVKHTSPVKLGAIDILLPPRGEQDQIAELYSDADECIAALERLITKKQAIKKGLMQHLLTPAEVPATWSQVRLLDLVSVRSGQVDPKGDRYRNLPLIAPDHISSGSGRLLETRSAAEQGAISGKYVVEPGDVIYSKIRPYLRKAYRCEFAALCSADMYPLIPKPGVSGSFILHTVLGEKFTDFATSVSARSGIPKINRAELAEFKMVAPPFGEQEAIGRALDDVDEQIVTLHRVMAKYEAVKTGMLRELITGRKRLFVEGESAA